MRTIRIARRAARRTLTTGCQNRARRKARRLGSKISRFNVSLEFTSKEYLLASWHIAKLNFFLCLSDVARSSQMSSRNKTKKAILIYATSLADPGIFNEGAEIAGCTENNLSLFVRAFQKSLTWC